MFSPQLSRLTRRHTQHHDVLRLLLCGAAAVVYFAHSASAASGSELDPNAFTSLGPSPFTTSGTYIINASRDNAAPTLSGPGIATPIAGVFHDPTPSDTTNQDEIAVFTFDSISIPASVTVQGARNANSRPIALLSKADFTIDGIVDVSVTASSSGLTDGVSTAFDITCPPIRAIVSGDAPVCPGGTSTLTIDLIGGTAPWSVLLSDGQTDDGTPPFNFSVTPPYTSTYQAIAVDADGCQAIGSFTVVVEDSSPPTLTLKPTAKLFPANHKYVTLPVTQMVASVGDNCSTLGVSDVVITRVTSDEPEDGTDDGSTRNDIVIAPGCKSVQLRAERAEQLNGRVYSVTLQVKDGEDNVGTAVYKVMVPTTSGGTAVEDGALYTVTGCSP